MFFFCQNPNISNRAYVDENGAEQYASQTYTVEVARVTGVTLDKKEAEVKSDKTLTLKATVTPSNATNKTVTWSSSDSTVVRVSQNGKITGAILQGDLAYGGILQQLIARKIDVTKVKKPIFDVDYSDFFHVRDNFEFWLNSFGELTASI